MGGESFRRSDISATNSAKGFASHKLPLPSERSPSMLRFLALAAIVLALSSTTVSAQPKYETHGKIVRLDRALRLHHPAQRQDGTPRQRLRMVRRPRLAQNRKIPPLQRHSQETKSSAGPNPTKPNRSSSPAATPARKNSPAKSPAPTASPSTPTATSSCAATATARSCGST